MDHPKSDGAMFPHKKTTDKQPDLKGHIVITKEQIQRLVEMSKNGQDMKLQVAAWKRKSKSDGSAYVYLATEAYMKQEEPAFADDGDLPF